MKFLRPADGDGPRMAMPAAVFLLGLCMSAGAAWLLYRDIDRHARIDFERHVEHVVDEVSRRIHQPAYGLNGASAVYRASPAVSRAAFRAYVASRDLAKEFPGVDGFGFLQRVAPGELAAFEAAERADGACRFSVQALPGRERETTAGERWIIRFMEPAATHADLLGLDVGGDPVRREAIERAVDTGQLAQTALTTLIGRGRRAPGLVLYLPVFRHGAPLSSPSERRAGLVGVLFAPLAIDQALGDKFDVSAGMVDFALFEDVRHLALNQAAFDTGAASTGAPGQAQAQPGPARFESVRTIHMHGRFVMIRVRSQAEFEALYAGSMPWTVFAGGLALSLLLAALFWQQASGRRRAEALARHMTGDLERLAQIVRHTTNAVSITDRDLRITWINDGFTRICGYTLDEALGQKHGELLDSGKADPAALQTLASAAADGVGCRVEILNRRKDGGTYWVDIEVQPLRDADGQVTGFMEIGTDITASKQVARELGRERLRLNNILEGTHVGTWEWNVQTGKTVFNERWAQMLGLTLAELGDTTIGTLRELTHPEDRSRSALQLERHFNGETPGYECETRLRHHDGHWVWVLSRGKLFSRSDDGRPRWMAGTHQDISGRKRDEARLQQASDLLRGSIDALDDAFSLFDPDDRLVLCNQRYRDLYPLAAEFIVPGNTAEQIMRGGAARGQYAAAIGREEAWVQERLAVHRQPASELQTRLSDGRTIRIVERRMPDGHTVGFRVDITAFIRATEAAQEASRLKSQFLANMSHEIRTPMNAILGMLALLRKTELTARQADYARKTEGAARSLLGLLNDILDFSKVEAGKMTLDPHPFRFDQLLRDLSVILSANTGSKNIEVLFDIDPALPRCLVGDATRLMQVLINLGGNAIKFTERGEVVVSAAVTSRSEAAVVVQIGVRDSGIGIAPENQARIFSGFTQAEASTTRRYGGTGLGLAISQRMVALMGGEMRLDSVLGQGSRFHFEIELPLAAEGSDDAAPDAAAAVPAKLRALVVDDNPTARELLERMVESLGWSAALVGSGEEALARLQSEPGAFDAVFVDWLMPGMDGWQTCEQIRALSLGGGAPLMVMVTAHGREMLAQRSAGEQALIDGFLVKPVTASMLYDAVVDARVERGGSPAPRKGTAVSLRRLQGFRLLVAEDNANNQQVARELLEDEGAEVLIANNGQEAVEAVAAAEPAFDVVLMDLQMPVMDGYTATSRIRQDLGRLDLPIVAMTANAMASDREACLAAGMNDHVGKPFDLDHLVKVLRRLARRSMPPAPSQSATPPAADLTPEVMAAAAAADVDLANAIRRLGGKAGVYRRSLGSFVRDLASIDNVLAGPPAADGMAAAARELHTLKGVAATLGVTRLASAAAEGERVLNGAPAPQQAAEAVTQVRQTIAAARSALGSLCKALDDAAQSPQAPVPASGPTPPRPADPAALVAALLSLQRMLADSDMGAIEAMASLRTGFPDVAKSAMEALDQAVGDLDFEGAQRHCHDCLSACQAQGLAS